MKVLIRPIVNPQTEIDVTERLVGAIAEELWRLFGGNAELNWLEAELHLARVLGEARTGASPGAAPEMSHPRRRGAPVKNHPRRRSAYKGRRLVCDVSSGR